LLAISGWALLILDMGREAEARQRAAAIVLAHRLLIAVVSLLVGHRLSVHRLQ